MSNTLFPFLFRADAGASYLFQDGTGTKATAATADGASVGDIFNCGNSGGTERFSATSTARPLLKTTAGNGYPVFRFDGATSAMKGFNTSLMDVVGNGGSWSIALIFKLTGTVPYNIGSTILSRENDQSFFDHALRTRLIRADEKVSGPSGATIPLFKVGSVVSMNPTHERRSGRVVELWITMVRSTVYSSRLAHAQAKAQVTARLSALTPSG